jgi:hypothetical protein
MSSLRDSLDAGGFVIVRKLLSQDEILRYRQACEHVITLARSGRWPHLRTLPKQFPPWSQDPSNGIWGVQHLLHPDLPGHDLFAESYFGDQVTGIASQLLGCREDELVMELYNLLVRPDADFELRWHRDDIPPDATREEEERRLLFGRTRSRAYAHTQWNLALFEDESLLVVPGSHRRARTDEERNAAPYERMLPGMMRVNLEPGDAVFYDNNILHRGVYLAEKERMTLHGSIGRTGFGDERSRNVLQHGIGTWVERCDLSHLDEPLRSRALRMKGHLLQLGSTGAGKVEYSQQD